MEEQWKRYYKNYSVSNLGRIRNDNTNNIRKLTKNSYGYLRTNITDRKNNTHKEIKIHRAVAELFISNPYNYPQVNHIDGNKENNCVTNLEWVTAAQNTQHAIKMNLRPQNMSKN